MNPDSEERPLLTFEWREREHRGLLLVLIFLATCGCAVLFFMLFKVVYPQAEYVSVSPHHVLMLDPKLPETRDLVNRTRDANFLLLAQDTSFSNTVIGTPGLSPVFQPSVAGYEMKLADLPVEKDENALPRLFSLQRMPLPPLTTISKPASAVSSGGSQVARVNLTVHGKLNERLVPGVNGCVNLTLADPTPVRFSIGVTKEGKVAAIVPLWATTDGRQLRLMHRAVSKLRFRPTPGESVEWGEVSLNWGGPS